MQRGLTDFKARELGLRSERLEDRVGVAVLLKG